MTNAVKSLYILYKIVKKAAPKTIILLRSLSLEDEGMGGKKESVFIYGETLMLEDRIHLQNRPSVKTP